MKKILYVYRERDFHISESAGRLIGEDLAADGRYELEMTTDLDAFAALPAGTMRRSSSTRPGAATSCAVRARPDCCSS